ncbi:MAG: hypothetical protein ACLSBH_10550 [Coprobacillus cateniformis]
MDEDHVKNEHVEEQETKTKSHKYILFIKEYKTKFLIGGEFYSYVFMHLDVFIIKIDLCHEQLLME